MRFFVITTLVLSYIFAVGSGAAWIWSLRNSLAPESLIFMISAILFLSSFAYIRLDKRLNFGVMPHKKEEDANA